MKIGVVCTDPGIPWRAPSGAAEHLRAISAAWSRREMTTVYCTKEVDHRGTDPQPPPAVPVEIHPVSARIFRSLCRQAHHRDLLRHAERQQQVIWLRHSVFTRPEKKYTFLEVNAPLSLENSPKRGGVIDRWERDALRGADRVIVVSNWLANWAASCGVASDRIRVVPNGADQIAMPDRSIIRKQWNFEKIWLVLGHERPWHGIPRLLDLLEHRPEVQVWVLGTTTAPLQHPQIRYGGMVARSQLGPWLAAADVLLAPYPSMAPPWFSPLKIATALAAGLPIVTGAFGDLIQQLQPPYGIAVKSERPEVWAEALDIASLFPRTPLSRSWDQVLEEAIGG